MSRAARLFVCAALPLFSGCLRSAAINKGYDVSRVQRIGVIRTGAADSQGVEDLFSKHLLDQGYVVVERERLDDLIDELNLGMNGTLAPETAKRIGQVLGVDALFVARVTGYEPERRSVVLVETVHTYDEPVIETKSIKQPDGTTKRIQEVVGKKTHQERTSSPRTHVIDAQIGLIAKLVDVETGELIWAGSATHEAVNVQIALDSAAFSLVKRLKKQWKDLQPEIAH